MTELTIEEVLAQQLRLNERLTRFRELASRRESLTPEEYQAERARIFAETDAPAVKS